MTESKEHFPLRIERMPDGGFVVSEAPMTDSGRYCGALFASTSIGEALAFIAGRLDPKSEGAYQSMADKMAAGPDRCPRCTDFRSRCKCGWARGSTFAGA